MPLATTPGRIQLGPHPEETSENTLGGNGLNPQVSVTRPPDVHSMPQRLRGL